MAEVVVGGIGVTPFQSMDEAVAHVLRNGDVQPGFGIAINPEKVIMAMRDSVLREQLNSGTLRFADGMGVVRTIRSKGVPNTRIPGVEFWHALMAGAANCGARVMVIGARPEVNAETAERLRAMGVNVVAAVDGYYKDEAELVAVLLEARPQLVSVAMGSPRQEQLIARLRAVYPDAFYQGVGGTYDVFTGRVKRAPELFCKLHLEWFYRLCAQPSRIFRQMNLVRYLWLHLRGRL